MYGPDDAVNQLSITLKSRFQLSEIGVLHWLLGIQVNVNYDIDADLRTISLSQGSYIDKILDRFGMSDCKPHRIPLATKHGLRKWQEKDTPADQNLYQEIIGCLIYLVTGTRPDLAFVTMFLSQFASKPNTQHMGALKGVLRYLKGTRDLKLTYRANRTNLIGYADSDYANDKDDSRSISGYIFQLNGNTISWRSKKRNRRVHTSTTEAELFAMSLASKHLLWLQEAMKELQPHSHSHPNPQDPSSSDDLYGDNQATLKLIRNQRNNNDLTKHVAVVYHFLRNLTLEQKLFHIRYIPTTENLADICTKSIARPQYEKLCQSILGEVVDADDVDNVE